MVVAICVHVPNVLNGKSSLEDTVLVEFNFVSRSRCRNLA
jgi:hypothetical protein